MRTHTANELLYKATILAPDGTTPITSGVDCGVTDLSGKRLEQAQLIAAETSHVVLMRGPDAARLNQRGYIQVDKLYVIDYTIDPRKPRQGMWIEVYCHVERAGN